QPWAGAYLKLDRIIAGLEAASKAVGDAIPYALCPLCKGQKCGECVGTGWVPQWKAPAGKKPAGRGKGKETRAAGPAVRGTPLYTGGCATPQHAEGEAVSKGNRVVKARMTTELIESIDRAVAGRNGVSPRALWRLSDFLRVACEEKLKKMARSRLQGKGKRK